MSMSLIESFFSLKDKVAVVTGAARGNGKAIATGFSKAGAFVYFIDLSEKELETIKTEIGNENARFLANDVTDIEQMQMSIDDIISEKKGIDILVNNAGITIGGVSSESYPTDFWLRTYNVNLISIFRLCQLVGKVMIKRERGVIINITSLGSELGFPANPAYVASKGGLRMLTKALARDWAKYNIRVNNLCPGYIKTDMTLKSYSDRKLCNERLERMMIKRWGTPEDLVGPAIFLASDASKYITGIDLYVDGGWTANGL